MDNTFKLLKTYIEATGYQIEESPVYEQFHGEYEQRNEVVDINYVITKKPRQRRKLQASEYSPEFESLWSIYPKRAGKNPKDTAFAAFENALAKFSLSTLMEGTKRYKKFCQATEKENTEFVMMASTFLGRQKCFLESWELPKSDLKLPRDNDKLEAFCRERNLPLANPGESFAEWRRRLEKLI